MASGSVLTPETASAASYIGMTAIVETNLHIFEGGVHSWPGSWIEDPYMRPTRVTWNSDERPNYAEIILENTRVEDWQDFLDPVDQIRVVLLSQEQAINDDGESVLATQRRIIFSGFPATVLASASDNDESVTIGCMGWRYYSNRISCNSQTVWGVGSTGVHGDLITGHPLIFNEGGRMNRDTSGGLGGNGRADDGASYLFTYQAIEGYSSAWEGHNFWTVGQTLEYLFNRFKDPDATLPLTVIIPQSVIQDLNATRIPEMDVEGMSLSDAITKVLSSVGYHWAVTPNRTTGRWELSTWKPGKGVGTADVHFPAAGTDLANMNVSKQTNRFDINYDYRNIVNDYLGIGALSRYENEWTLRKGWSASEGQDPEYYYRSGINETVNPDWEAYKDVFRRWVIDGAGLITGTKRDFAGTIGAYYQERPRHLDDQALTKETDENDRKPAEVWLHHDGAWKRMDGNVDIFAEGFADGIYIDGKQITVDGGTEGEALVDIMTDVDEVKVLTAIEGDLTTEVLLGNSASQGNYLTRQKSLRLPDYKFEDREANEYGGTEVLRDDITELQGFLAQKLAATKDPVMSVSITTPLIYYNLVPGTTIGRITGRDIEINSEVISVDFLLTEQELQISLADTRMRRFT